MIKHRIKGVLKFLAEKSGFEVARRSRFRDAWEAQRVLLNGVENPLVFDVGAHTGGTFNRYKNLFPHLMIHCFEPLPESFEALTTTVGSAAQENGAFLHHLALSNQAGEHDFHVSREYPATSSLFPRSSQLRRYYASNAELKETIRVKTETLDRFCEENSVAKINILKMDVQGCELRVLQGATDLLGRYAIDVIYTEVLFISHYDNAPLFPSIALFLAERNYSLYGLYNLELAKNGQLRYGDAIFVSRTIRNNVIDAFPEES